MHATLSMIMEMKSAHLLCQSTFNLVTKNQQKMLQHQRKQLKLKKKSNHKLLMMHHLQRLNNNQIKKKLKQPLKKQIHHQNQLKRRVQYMLKFTKQEVLWPHQMLKWNLLLKKLRKKQLLDKKHLHFPNKSQILNKNNSVD